MIPKKPVLGLDPRMEPGFRTRSCSNEKPRLRSNSIELDRSLGPQRSQRRELAAANLVVRDGIATLPQHRPQRTVVDKKVEPAHRGSAAEINAAIVGAAEEFGEVAIYAHVVSFRTAAWVAAVVARHHVSQSIAGAGRLPCFDAARSR